MILKVQHLSFSYGSTSSTWILKDINFQVRQGEFVTLVGTSGCGKSTLFKTIAGLLEPSTGEVFVEGEETTSQAGKIGFMPQKDLLLPWRTVVDNILLGVEITGGKKAVKQQLPHAMGWLERFGLAAYANSLPPQLSGGMRQRVALLRTIMTGKTVLLLDEPFGALDSMTKKSVHHWLLGLWEDLQRTVLFITHDLEEALLLSDRVLILHHGSVLEEMVVDLKRPRKAEMVYEPEFVSLRKELERRIWHGSV